MFHGSPIQQMHVLANERAILLGKTDAFSVNRVKTIDAETIRIRALYPGWNLGGDAEKFKNELKAETAQQPPTNYYEKFRRENPHQ